MAYCSPGLSARTRIRSTSTKQTISVTNPCGMLDRGMEYPVGASPTYRQAQVGFSKAGERRGGGVGGLEKLRSVVNKQRPYHLASCRPGSGGSQVALYDSVLSLSGSPYVLVDHYNLHGFTWNPGNQVGLGCSGPGRRDSVTGSPCELLTGRGRSCKWWDTMVQMVTIVTLSWK